MALLTWGPPAWADAPPPRTSPEDDAALEAVKRGDALFDAGSMEEALAVYDSVPRASLVGSYARYKSAWCLVNLSRPADALGRFRELAIAGRSSLVENAKAVGREAAKDCAMVYAMVGDPKKALAFFEELSPERFLDLTERVATAYADSAMYPEAEVVLAALTAAVSGRRDLAPEAYRAARYQRLLLDLAWRIGDRARLAAAAKPLPERWAAARPIATEKWRAEEHEELRTLVVAILEEMRREAARALPRDELRARMEAISGPYLKVFPEDADALPAAPR